MALPVVGEKMSLPVVGEKSRVGSERPGWVAQPRGNIIIGSWL